LAAPGKKEKSVGEIREIASGAGLREAQRWNISDLLRRSEGCAIRTPNGWELREFPESLKHLRRSQSATGGTLHRLRNRLSNISEPSRSFIEEAVACLEHDLYRSAVVLSWVGAVALLFDHVISHKLNEFNTAAGIRLSKWRPAVTADDLARIKETEFLDVLEAISVIGKSVKKQLINCLDLRNGCGHPNSLRIADHTAAAHIEVLLLNVYTRF
jgi:hypothetical protein